MLKMIFYIFELKKELLVCLSLSVLYVTYYLVEVVKKPLLICGKGEFRQMLEEKVPLLNEPYWPTPWCVESRLQTVIASVLRSRILPTVNYRREILRLSDGGQVALDWADAPGGDATRPVMLVLPGLTGGSHADYVRCLVAAARQLGAHCVVFNNRGLGGVPLTTPRLYCAVSHEDLAEVVEAVRGRGGPLLGVGVSLGGLILGHYLAAHGERARLHAALIVSSPLDVERGSACIERPPLNALLSRHMARNLRNTVRAHAPLRAGPWDWAAVDASRSVRQFDAAFTTKHFGFASVEHYYRAATLRGKLERVRVPLLCLCAADDPFQPLHGE
ncbi:phospholipase ABHD3 [Zerene cesonia]|uniref:phospholipase ABHD3 n=1 Tax=Zerene cesonia TaxID=33412 RepID=UPI0018E54D89|nr:phospholipase ABHD3 [Zerene cesonia]